MSRRFLLILLVMSSVLLLNFSLIVYFEQQQKAELVDFAEQGVGNQLWQIFQFRGEFNRLREAVDNRDEDDLSLRFDIVFSRVHSFEMDATLKQFSDPVLRTALLPSLKQLVTSIDQQIRTRPLTPARWAQLQQQINAQQEPIEDMVQRIRTEETKRNDLKKDRLAKLGFWRVLLASLQVVLLLAFAALALRGLWRSEQQRHKLQQLNQSLLEARQQAEAANATKSRFLAHISHEIRTPLTSILGYTERLRQNSELSETQKLHLGHIAHSGEHLLSLLNHVLDLSKSESGKLELVNEPLRLAKLKSELEGMFALMAQQKALTLSIEYADDLPGSLLLDAGKLRQILINLIGNSMKFTEQGFVRLEICGVALANRQYLLRAKVSDSGCGIAAYELANLFHPFEQTESGKHLGGTGLGLALSRDFARLMGGDIQASSTQGQGSEFIVTLIAAIADEAGAQAQAVVHHEGLSALGKIILVVEDQEVNRDLLCEILDEAGAKPLGAENGLDALQILRQKPEIDFVLMDFHMPGPDGLLTCAQMREQGMTQPVYLISASPEYELRQRPEFALLAGYLSKPYQAQDLLEMLGLNGQPMLVQAVEDADDKVMAWQQAQAYLGFSNERFLALAEKGFIRLQDLEQDFVLALQQGQLDEAKRHAHSAKGIASQLGALALAKNWALFEANPLLQEPGMDEIAALRIHCLALLKQ
ncbi:ATP-binding protein [Chitinibacter sp. FCG-7]|uniref:Virulence sensor protein BvgS n=1 Tax=Chitinibacter mangrovi TaxID=3153927 RepID=A0AAU7FE60_9NEIS